MKQQLARLGLLAGSAIAAASLVACGGGSSSDSSSTPAQTPTTGFVNVALTDAPACGFDAVYVTVTKLRFNKSATAADTDTSWVDLPVTPARKINLLTLTNGARDVLGWKELDPGHYAQMRLVLDPNGNSVIPTGETGEKPLNTPSAVQSGIKLTGEFDVTTSTTTDIMLDFDACKSVFLNGKDQDGKNQYALRPVVTMVPVANNGISGVVAPAALPNHVMVTAQQNGKIVAATTPDRTNGMFVLPHLAAGNYDVVITSDNSSASVIGAVPVTATATTVVATAGAPIALQVANTGSIGGTVTLNPASTTSVAYVAAKQTFAAGPTVTIKYQGADLSTGAYNLSNLPMAAPRYVAYSTTLPLAFGNAAVTPGSYTVEASAAGYTTKSVDEVNVIGAGPAKADFTLVP